MAIKMRAELAAILLCAVASYVDAAPVTQPGEQIGFTAGYPLPEGFYAIDTFSFGRSEYRNSPNIGVNIPLIVWSSPFKFLGARVEPLLAVPSVFVNTRNPAPIPNSDVSVFFNPIVGSTFAWNLGGGIGVSYLIGAYLPLGDRGSLGLGVAGTPVVPQTASTTVRQTFFATFVGDGSYNLTSALTYNLTVDPRARYGGQVGAVIGSIPLADALNLDLTATRKFGKLEVGPVAFAYTDLPVNRNDPIYRNYRLGAYVAVGCLIGYDFDRFAIQTYVTRQIIAREALSAEGLRQHNEETRGWLRIVVPFPSSSIAEANVTSQSPIVRKN